MTQPETPPSPRFQVGDLVRHRASGTRGVVVRVNENQTKPPRYDVSTDFGTGAAMLPEIVLEPWTGPVYAYERAEAKGRERIIDELKKKLEK